jgi:hypothetical protein
MLANGSKLGFKANGSTGTEFTNLIGLQELPELGIDPEKVEVTTLADTAKKYEYGIGDYGNLDFVFKYENTTNSSYRKLKAAQAAGKVDDYQLELMDGTKFTFSGYCNLKIKGGKVNDPVTFTLQIALQSEIAVTDPA